MLYKKWDRIKYIVSRVWFEVLLMAIALSVAVICLPAEVSAGEKEQGQYGAEAAAASGDPKDTTSGEAAEAAVDNERGEVETWQDNEAAYRVKPLQDKLAALDSGEITAALAAFKDMGTHWSRKEVGKLSCIEIIAGVNGMFLPESPVQIDQFIKMTVRAMGYTPGDFAGYWAKNYIDTAVKEKLIGQNEFKDYKRAITREEAANIIVKATLLKEELPCKDPYNNPDNLVRSKILDYAKIKDANKQLVLHSYQIGLMRGVNGRFMPADTLTRAEAATIIMRYLDIESRVPFKVEESDVYTYTGTDGTAVTVYPPPKTEVIKAANAFKTVTGESKGYVSENYSVDGYRISYSFYESKEAYDKNSVTNTQMAVNLDTLNDEYFMEHPYYITIYDAMSVKNLHRDVIFEMFKFWFEKDVDKAMSEFDRYLKYATGNDKKHRIEEITYNSRRMFFYKVGEDDGFTLKINSLPK